MLVPAIHFPGGKCAEAIADYQKIFHGEVLSVAYYRDAPPDSGMATTEEIGNYVMHAEMEICGTRMNMCDVIEEVTPGNMFLFNIFLDTTDEVTTAFHQLKEGGEIITELAAQFWTPMYGEVIDRFGIHWQLMAK